MEYADVSCNTEDTRLQRRKRRKSEISRAPREGRSTKSNNPEGIAANCRSCLASVPRVPVRLRNRRHRVAEHQLHRLAQHLVRRLFSSRKPFREIRPGHPKGLGQMLRAARDLEGEEQGGRNVQRLVG